MLIFKSCKGTKIKFQEQERWLKFEDAHSRLIKQFSLSFCVRTISGSRQLASQNCFFHLSAKLITVCDVNFSDQSQLLDKLKHTVRYLSLDLGLDEHRRNHHSTVMISVWFPNEVQGKGLGATKRVQYDTYHELLLCTGPQARWTQGNKERNGSPSSSWDNWEEKTQHEECKQHNCGWVRRTLVRQLQLQVTEQVPLNLDKAPLLCLGIIWPDDLLSQSHPSGCALPTLI